MRPLRMEESLEKGSDLFCTERLSPPLPIFAERRRSEG